MNRLTRSRAWTPLDVSIMLLMLGVCLWAFRSPFQDIIALATSDEEHSHILLAPIVALWLIWLRRSRLKLKTVRPTHAGPLIVLLGCFVSWWGFQSDTYIAWHSGGIIALFGMLISMTGWEPIRQFGPAAFALLFLLPVPGSIRQEISIPLQAIAASTTHTFMELFGFQVGRLGNVLLVNGEQVAVAEACNGMRLVFSLTIVVYAFVFSVPLRLGTRIVLILLSPLVALIANVVRLIPTSVLYGITDPSRAELFHDISGWAMLPLALIALISLLKLFNWLYLPCNSFRLARQ
jgi:exosortase